MSNTLSISKQEPFIVSTTYIDIRLHSVATKLEMTWDSFTINELVLVKVFPPKEADECDDGRDGKVQSSNFANGSPVP